MTKYDCTKFHVKSRFLSGFRQAGREGALCALPRGMIRQKYPGAARVNYQKFGYFQCYGKISYMIYLPFSSA